MPYKDHEKKKAYDRDYYKAHKEKIIAYQKTYCKSRSEKIKARDKAYRQTPKGKEVNSRHIAKHRQRGFTLLNAFFEGSEGHHINNHHVVYIPKELHRSIWHSIGKGINMDAINTLALEFIEQNKPLAMF